MTFPQTQVTLHLGSLGTPQMLTSITSNVPHPQTLSSDYDLADAACRPRRTSACKVKKHELFGLREKRKPYKVSGGLLLPFISPSLLIPYLGLSPKSSESLSGGAPNHRSPAPTRKGGPAGRGLGSPTPRPSALPPSPGLPGTLTELAAPLTRRRGH